MLKKTSVSGDIQGTMMSTKHIIKSNYHILHLGLSGLSRAGLGLSDLLVLEAGLGLLGLSVLEAGSGSGLSEAGLSFSEAGSSLYEPLRASQSNLFRSAMIFKIGMNGFVQES